MRALEILLERRWILKSREKELYYQIKDELGTVKKFLMEKLGYQVIVNPYLVKVEKMPATPENWMGIQEFTRKIEYVFFCMILMFLEEKEAEEQFVLSELTEYIQGQYREEQIDWSTMEPSIIVADDLTPSETVQMDKSKILAFVTVHGSTNSHTAILARMMNIPALIGVPLELEKIHNGTRAIVDGREAVFYLDPEEEQLRQAEAAQQTEQRLRSLLADYKGRESVTKSGRKVNVYANIGSVSDVAYVLENDAEGIGLFRSEFLYLNSPDYPTEDQQFEAYKKVLADMGGKEVIIRTLDIGADKQIGYFNLPKEDNPAMGMRALRICLNRPEIFKTQLRALYRASAFGKLGIMFPMVTSVWEVREAKKYCEEVKRDLKAEGIPFAEDVQVGIMIETPAAAIMSDRLAKEVDFFSCGTNDLTQYTLACDRQNNDLGRFYDPHNPAVLRLLKMVTENAHKNGIWVGICGELGADLTLTETFLAIGVDELSVSPRAVLPLRNAVRMTDTRESAPRLLAAIDAEYPETLLGALRRICVPSLKRRNRRNFKL